MPKSYTLDEIYECLDNVPDKEVLEIVNCIDDLDSIMEDLDELGNGLHFINSTLKELEKQQQELHYKITYIIQHNSTVVGINEKISVKEELSKNNQEYKETVAMQKETSNAILKTRQNRDKIINSQKSLSHEYNDKIVVIEDKLYEYLSAYYEDNITETSLETKLEDAVDYIVDTFYSFKDDNFYYNRLNKVNIADKDKLVDFKAYVLYTIGARYAKKTGIDDLSKIDVNSVNKQKSQELILAYHILQARSGSERTIAIHNLVDMDILTKEEKTNYILDEQF